MIHFIKKNQITNLSILSEENPIKYVRAYTQVNR